MRFTKPKHIPLAGDSHSMPYKRRGDESLWKCWNCGFICDEDRDDSSGSKAGDNHLVNALPACGGTGLDGMIIPIEIGTECRLMEQDADGDVTIHHIYSTNVTKGCPFCGSTNYKG